MPGKTTNCEPNFRTMGVSCAAAPKPGGPVDYPCLPAGQAVPWCAPGSAPVRSPCGVFAGGGPLLPHGRDMLDLPPTARPERWMAGEPADVAWSITANHGGG